MSVPFSGKPFTFRQPDGSELFVRGWGDQHYAVFEALNGYTLVRDPVTGFFQYADVTKDGDELVPTGGRPRIVDPTKLGIGRGVRISMAAARAKAIEAPGLTPGNARWQQRRRSVRLQRERFIASGNQPMLAPPKQESVGDYLGLCLLIQFPDEPATIAVEEVDRFCNQVGYSGFGNNGSVFDYFSEISGGKLRYRNIVAPYYTARHPKDYYTKEEIPFPERTRELIKEALEFHQANGFDFSALTVDGQQFVRAVNVFYAGGLVNSWCKGLWPHSHFLQTPVQLAPDRMANDYQITHMGEGLTLGTFCHENGHMVCDFPDLYDYGNESAGVGHFCLMCMGMYATEKNPAHVGAYLKFKAGWARSMQRIEPGQPLVAAAGTNEFFFLRNGSTEYYIVENRHQSGRDAGLPGSGLAIWHIDELGDNSNEQMTAVKHYECALIQADGRHDLENNPANLGDATDLFFQGGNDGFGIATTPRSVWWDGSASELDIRAIGPAGMTMTFSG
ncbi:M6 family metalloprotease domain-containing protein [Cupriavidus pauculus]|uniref:M6 family metalloprotease domain-containing protein n=1 Tax=Cupriavidus pauculus TaxID=82633 RepID=UPI001EE2DAA9|nr:M6 family metalloprotease domain-containing protein [Cupriavidus pauculus]GJG94407.1 hypothetical protein CBA19C6_07980 [Cupriavidus pauculus]